MNRGFVLTIVAFVLLGVIAVMGWVRTPTPVAAANLSPECFSQPLAPVTPATWSAAYSDTANASAAAPARVQRVYVQTQTVKRKRPLSHSVAIVAGSAGAGAAIGALAGGGKGAGIGAISGGAAGLIYDRLTHKR